MNENELHRQKFQAQLDEWKADIAKVKAQAAGAKADAQLTMHQQVAALERNLEEAQAKLAELAEAQGDAWNSVKNNVKSAWDSLKSAVSDVSSSSKD